MRELPYTHHVYAQIYASSIPKTSILHELRHSQSQSQRLRLSLRILIVIVARCVCLNCFWGFVRCNEILILLKTYLPRRAWLCQRQARGRERTGTNEETEAGTFRLHWHKDFRTWQAAAIIYRGCCVSTSCVAKDDDAAASVATTWGTHKHTHTHSHTQRNILLR